MWWNITTSHRKYQTVRPPYCFARNNLVPMALGKDLGTKVGAEVTVGPSDVSFDQCGQITLLGPDGPKKLQPQTLDLSQGRLAASPETWVKPGLIVNFWVNWNRLKTSSSCSRGRAKEQLLRFPPHPFTSQPLSPIFYSFSSPSYLLNTIDFHEKKWKRLQWKLMPSRGTLHCM